MVRWDIVLWTPRGISSELSAFLNIPHDTKISKSDAMNIIYKYIKDNNLQCEDNPRYINLDTNLSELFKMHSYDEPLSYYNIHSRMARHFDKLEEESVYT